MKHIFSFLLILISVTSFSQNLGNPAVIGQSTRNQKVAKGFQIEDTLLAKGKVRFSVISTASTKDTFVTMVDTAGYITKVGKSTFLSGVGGVSQSTLNDTASALDTRIAAKQNTLVSGTNIKTINSTTLLGSGNLPINLGVSYRADSIRFYVVGGTDTAVAGYAVRGLAYASDTLSWYVGNIRTASYIGGGGGSSTNGWTDSVGVPLTDTLKNAYRKGNLLVNGIMVGRGRLNIPFNTAVGVGALNLANTTSAYLSAYGHGALERNTTGAYNSAFGYLSLNQNIINSYLNAFGTEALYNTKANDNSGFGYRAGFSNITGVNNAYFGNNAGYAGLASYNSFFGDLSGRNYTGSYGTGCGQASLFTATTGSQTAVGANALYSTTGADNVGVGFQSGQGLTSGTSNFLGGKQSGFSLGSGSNNVMIGHFAGNVTTSSSNTFIGSTSGQLVTVGAKNTYIGRYTGSSHVSRSKLIILSDGDGTIGMLIDSVQRVGIGNEVPTAKLSVQGSATVSTSTPSAPDASAVLEIQSTTQGFRLVPMTATQASAITAVEGLMLFVSDTNGTFTSIGLWCYENGAWSKK